MIEPLLVIGGIVFLGLFLYFGFDLFQVFYDLLGVVFKIALIVGLIIGVAIITGVITVPPSWGSQWI